MKMRVVFVGSSHVALSAAALLIDRGHEVILIESEREKIEQLSDEMDCGFLHGDGSSPELLREADPAATDMLYCLTENDQVNILASLVGRSLGYERVVTRVESSEYEPICQELGLDNVIVPDRTFGRYLADMLEGRGIVELSTAIKGEARLFSFVAGEDDEGELDALELPEEAQVVWLYRGDDFRLASGDTHLEEGDEVVIATHSKNLDALYERWNPKESGDD